MCSSDLALKDYERTPHKGIQDVLKVSYDGLGLNAQVVFLDIACFFKGDRIEYVEEILDEFGAVSNIEELVNKSLLIVKHGCLDMHDLIQDMGRDIVKQEAPQNPAGRSRLWFHEDVIDVLSDENSVRIESFIFISKYLYIIVCFINDNQSFTLMNMSLVQLYLQ